MEGDSIESESQLSQLHKGSRDINPSRTAKEGEQEKCLSLDKCRAGYGAQFSKSHNRLQCMLSNDDDVLYNDVRNAYYSTRGAYKKFVNSHNKYLSLALTCDPENLKSRCDYYLQVSELMNQAENDYKEYKLQNEIQPEDSVSQFSAVTSHVSKTSQVSEALAKSTAKRAALSAKIRTLHDQRVKRLDLEHKRLEAEMRQKETEMDIQELEMEAELKAVEAEEEMLTKFAGSETMNPDRSSAEAIQRNMDSVGSDKRIVCREQLTPHSVLKSDAAYEVPSVKNTPTSSEIQRLGPGVQTQKLTEIPIMEHRRNGTTSGSIDVRSLVDALKLPNVRMAHFDGNPLQFTAFMKKFDAVVGNSSVSDGDKFNCLFEYCTNEVQKVIECCIYMTPEEGYLRARNILKERYGNEYLIAKAWKNKITNGESIKSGNGPMLQVFTDEVRSCFETLKAIGRTGQIETEDSMVSVIRRLPKGYHSRWRGLVRKTKASQGRYPNFSELVNFLEEVTAEENDPIYGTSEENNNSKHGIINRSSKNFSVKSSNYTKPVNTKYPKTKSGEVKSVQMCKVCQQNHSLTVCEQFRAMTPDQRLKIVKEKHLCYNCLDFTHRYNQCYKSKNCDQVGCLQKHSHLLHDALVKGTSRQTTINIEEINAKSCACTPSDAETNHIAMPIVSVYVRGKGMTEFIKTYALLDTGSNRTFCDRRLINQLNLQGIPTSLTLETLNEEKNSEALEVALEVKGTKHGNKKKPTQLHKVYALDSFPDLTTNGNSMPTDVSKWPHLSDLTFVKEGPVMLLIGQDVPSALVPLEVRRGGDDEPYATRTVLGWTLNGPLKGESISDAAIKCNFIQADWDHDRRLEAQVEQFWKLDVKPTLAGSNPQMSQNDQRVLELWNKSVHKSGPHYEMDIPFKRSPPDLMNNRYMAEKRLQYLGQKLAKNPQLYENYKQGIEDLLKEGFAEPVPDDPVDNEWYLPHHNVVNPNKPDKFRIVFDCAAEYGGTSLNKQVLQGPDLTNQLIGVLLKFREGKVAIQADIKSMFHMVKVSPEHRDVLRFLWWKNGEIGGKLKIYRMTVHLFGGVWSPSCASFALRHTAEESSSKYSPESVETVLKCFYVDDLLCSVDTKEKAIKLAEELTEMLKEGGFHLTKWVSNSKEVLESIPQAERAKQIKTLDLDVDNLPVERALGVHWDTNEDSFFIKVREKEPVFTRRGLLKIYSSVYDPLGFVSPFILVPKKIFQAECRLAKGWDEIMEPENIKIWQIWLDDLPKLENFRMPRYVLPEDFGEVKEARLHHFSDASSECYGAVSYLRAVNMQGLVHCTFLMSKSRLAPLKQMSIPRLELSAAVISVQLDSLLKKHLKIPLLESVFWTDSTIVLQYITNRTKRFHVYVANRVAVILDGSNPRQWRYVDTKRNPADDISRGLKADDMLSNTRWRNGPNYIWSSEENWPAIPEGASITLSEDDPEVKREVKSCIVSADEDSTMKFLSHYSSWFSVCKAVAWLQRMIKWLREGKPRRQPQPLRVEDLQMAETAILKFIQGRHYHREINMLKTSNEVPRSSQIYSLEPYLDQDGLLRVTGRLDSACIPDSAKHPAIVPRESHIALLIVRNVHEWESRHSGREYVIAKLRRKYWITKVRPLVKKVLQQCVICKYLRGKFAEQRMADLPIDRVVSDNPPWTNCGIDVFGQFLVKRGRSQEKRWGCIFSCQATRAIHIEKLNTLESDSFINALMRFTARRGVPKKIRSDNGGNFTLGEKELRRSIEEWNQSNKTKAFLLLRKIDWSFQVPRASHMSGCTERQIRTVRNVLNALLRKQVLDDEKLDTIFAEVENIVNSRPLTYVSDDPKDPHPLTPNDLIRVGEGFTAPPGDFQKHDAYGKRWRHVQLIVNQFWKRWTAEYLPIIQQRSKWIETQRNIQVGDVVLILDESLPRSHWPLGRVIRVCPGRDGLVRAVEMKTAHSERVMRPIHKVCLLEAVHEEFEVGAAKN